VFGVAYRAYLVQEWIPALDGVEAKLRAGARVADVGCGYGTAAIILAQAFPTSTFVGFDYHPESIERARANAAAAGVEDRVRFEVARRPPSRAPATTSSPASTRCTTSATPPPPRATSARR
jgi:tRNA/tmRNA/rRNA uracil-C5-methylase (TrmA/RlmC/RlmD family)